MNKNFGEASKFYCTKCGKEAMPVFRTPKNQRGPGHLKVLYCPHCKDVHNCVEIKPMSNYTKEIFNFEFKNGNFDKEGNRKIPWPQFLREKGFDANE